MAALAKMMSKFRLAVVQLHVSSVKTDNLRRARALVKEAAGQGGRVVLLPECFNSPYGTNFFPEYAERIPGESTQMLSEVAKESEVYLVGGSIPEKDEGKLYNSCTVFGPDGVMILKHRKRSVKWEWGFAMTCGLLSLHNCTEAKVASCWFTQEPST